DTRGVGPESGVSAATDLCGTWHSSGQGVAHSSGRLPVGRRSICDDRTRSWAWCNWDGSWGKPETTQKRL
ncbi:uncharacterized protein METZ01_LOCUS450503, partial [marine metagenome]